MRNEGKRFEANFKNSIPKEIYYMRLKDNAGSWQGTSEKARFTPSNACDCILHYRGYLFLAELKSYKGKSIPFHCFRDTQLQELYKLIPREEELAVAVFNYRDIEETYMVHIADVKEFIETSTLNDTRKSFPINWVREVGYFVPHERKKVNYTYDVLDTLNVLLNEMGA